MSGKKEKDQVFPDLFLSLSGILLESFKLCQYPVIVDDAELVCRSRYDIRSVLVPHRDAGERDRA